MGHRFEAGRWGRGARIFGLSLALCAACATSSSLPDGGAGSGAQSSASAAPAVAASGSSATVASASSDPLPSASAARAKEAEAFRYADLVNDLSEPDTYFFSDNIISNETSFLQIGPDLAKRSDPSGVYLGVGPEQNFSYIALSRPSLAFVVDIRRANMLLHLLYRAAFEEAANRPQFVALLLGRPTDGLTVEASAGAKDVLDAATKSDATAATFEAAKTKLMKRVEGYGVKLSDEDKASIAKMHKSFFDSQLKIRFELHEKNGRMYPTLRELLETKSPDGSAGSFIASEEGFRFVQSMQRAGRIVPVVGDFAGDKALTQIAAYLKSENLAVSVFYTSNVEQYLLEPKMWKNWVRNVKALPKSQDAVFLRAYLDQGRNHPKQMNGHRTASILSSMADFETRYGDKPTTTFWALCTDNVVAPK